MTGRILRASAKTTNGPAGPKRVQRPATRKIANPENASLRRVRRQCRALTERLVERSYRAVALKRMLAALDGGRAGRRG